ncbi:MAG: prolyl oligopeptidase family serine peptidase [Panacibacter sp.]
MKNLLAVVLLLCSFSLAAQDMSLYQKKEYTSSDGKVLPYRILYPENYNKSIKYPVILFLHGAGERGNDNEAQLTHGARLFLADSNRKKFPCMVIIPQCPKESYWSSVTIDRSTFPVMLTFNYDSTSATWPLASSIAVLKQTIQNESADISRIYITGLSMGGMGTFEAVYRNPGLFAAAMPICGGGDAQHYDKRVEKTPFWVFHGAADAVVNVNQSRSMVEKLKALKVDVTYTEYPGVNHNSWDNAFAEPTYLSWMFSHRRKNVKL